MGYRSDVAIGMAFPDRDAVVAFLSAAKLSGTIPVAELETYTITEVSEAMVLLHANFDDVKWYTDYADVKCHHNLLGMAADAGAGTAFVRTGEEHGDNEVSIDDGEGNYALWDYYGLERRVVAPDPGTPISEYINTTKE